MRLVFEDPKSDEEDNIVYDEFTVTIKNRCTENTLTLTESLGEILYYIDDARTAEYDLSFTQSESTVTCSITYTLQLWDESE